MNTLCNGFADVCISYFMTIILRYGKFQSTAGVEDESRVPQGKMMKWIPTVMDFVVNLNRYEMYDA